MKNHKLNLRITYMCIKEFMLYNQIIDFQLYDLIMSSTNSKNLFNSSKQEVT